MYKEHVGLLYKERYPLCSEEIGKEKTAKKHFLLSESISTSQRAPI